MKNSVGLFCALLALLLLTLTSLSFGDPLAPRPEQASSVEQSDSAIVGDHVALVKLDMMILPGTGNYLAQSIERAPLQGAKAVVVLLNTPGGVLDTTQEMVRAILASKIPVFIYVSPQGGTASSAGVFITLAGHVAAMAPGTTIGAATPINGDGKDIGGDLRQKAINATISMARSLADQRGRNASWAEDAVKNASSVTAQEALKLKVVDFIVPSIEELLKVSAGKKVMLDGKEIILEDYSKLPVVDYPMALKDRVINFLANPNVVALLWLLATTGLTIELYNPGLVIPGIVGVISLILALSVSSVLPVSQAAVALLVLGVVLITVELFTGSLVLGVGGVAAMIFGALYLVDPMAAPGLGIDMQVIAPIVAIFGLLLLFIAVQGARVLRSKGFKTGKEGMVGLKGRVLTTFEKQPTQDLLGKISVRGEVWNATSESHQEVKIGDEVEVTGTGEGLLLKVKKL